MAIFGKEPKKLTLDEILKGIDNLPEEDKQKVNEKMQDLYKAEDEREEDKIESEKADDKVEESEKQEEEQEESKEIGKDVDEVEEEVNNDEVKEDENKDEKGEVLKSLTDRIAALEEKLNKYDGLFAKMEEINKKHADDIGYKGVTPNGKKSYNDMSAKELEAELKTEI